jgi:hypothetical protein
MLGTEEEKCRSSNTLVPPAIHGRCADVARSMKPFFIVFCVASPRRNCQGIYCRDLGGDDWMRICDVNSADVIGGSHNMEATNEEWAQGCK